jgi:hypothetical protein
MKYQVVSKRKIVTKTVMVKIFISSKLCKFWYCVGEEGASRKAYPGPYKYILFSVLLTNIVLLIAMTYEFPM